jgi:hypothetical protein
MKNGMASTAFLKGVFLELVNTNTAAWYNANKENKLNAAHNQLDPCCVRWISINDDGGLMATA